MTRILSAGAARLAAALALACSLAGPALAQGSAFWHGVRSNAWSDGIAGGVSNWYSQAPPNGGVRPVPLATATFANGAVRTAVRTVEDIRINAMRFLANVEQYQFTVRHLFEIVGTGIVNGAATTPQFQIGTNGILSFQGAATINAPGGGDGANIEAINNGKVQFEDTSDGGNATIELDNNASLLFRDRGSAGRLFINSRSVTSRITFQNRSTGDRATILNSGKLKFDSLGPAGNQVVSTGSIDNRKEMDVGTTTLNVFGSLKLRTNSELAMRINQKAGIIVVNTDATLGGTIRVAGQGTIKLKRYVLLRAKKSRTGRFRGNVQVSGSLLGRSARLAYQGNDVVLLLN